MLDQELENIQNYFAHTSKRDPIYIDDAESGAKGYFCMGCGRPMQAVKHTTHNIRSYFRHDVKDILRVNRCTYNDLDFRHNLAQEHILLEKKIKLPAVVKFPPKGIDGNCYVLLESKDYYFKNVKREVVISEDENGEIQWGKGMISSQSNLLIRADLAFFENGKPILLIELVATHKITDEKKAKIRRLGIDTLQIRIPKSSREDIIESLSSNKNSKWIYNNVEQNTTYVQTTRLSDGSIHEIDELQRTLFEETFKCRSAEIGDLIRSIEKSYRSEYYRSIESGLRSELLRIEENTERIRFEVRELRIQIEEKIRNQFGNEEAAIDKTRNFIKRKHDDLEKRYSIKKEQLRIEEESLDFRIQEEFQLEGKSEFDFEARTSEIREESENLAGKIGRAREELSIIEEEQKGLESNIRNEFQDKVGRIKTNIEGEEGNIERFRNRIEKLRGYISGENDGEGDYDFQQYTSRIQRFFDNRGLLSVFSKSKYVYERIRDCREAIRSGDFKNWDK